MTTASDLASAGILPAPRFAPYKHEASNNLSDANDLYVWHGEMSASCMELLSHFEVILRHSIDSTLANHFREHDRNIPWFLMNTKLAKEFLTKYQKLEPMPHVTISKAETTLSLVSCLDFGLTCSPESTMSSGKKHFTMHFLMRVALAVK